MDVKGCLCVLIKNLKRYEVKNSSVCNNPTLYYGFGIDVN